MFLRIGAKTYRADKTGSSLDPRASIRSAVRYRGEQTAGRTKRAKVKPPQFPRSAEMAYRKELLPYVATAKAVLDKHLNMAMNHIFATSAAFLKGDRRDDYAEIISEVFGDIEIEFEQRVKKDRTKTARAAAKRIEEANKKEIGRYFNALIGIDVGQAEPWLGQFTDLFVESNVGLIKSISSTYFSQVRAIVSQAAVTGQRPESLAADIEERFGVSESRAKLIARDQVAKYNGQLAAARQQRLGIKKFVWRTSLDERVRTSHADKEGKSYEWQDPPHDTGMPGEDYQCRCTAEPNLDDLAEEF